MIKIGLTGGIGSGKSVVAKVFQSLGIKIYYADNESKKFLFDLKVQKKLIDRFGENVIIDSKPNTKYIASIVFNIEEELSWLNKLIHPLVEEDFENWTIKYKDEAYIIHEAAILIESGFYKKFDKIITVSANKQERIQRVIKRDNVDVDDVMRRIEMQISDKEREKYSDFIIYNNNEDAILEIILSIHNQLRY